jgi:pimeloyl-ACP methyl ester carboxylesterase
MIMTFPIQNKETHGASEKTPILMVHGFLHNRSAWVFQKKFLERHVGPIYTVNLGSPLHSIEQYAEMVQKTALRIQNETGRKDLVLIGHSMGGLVAATFADRFKEQGEIKGLVTLGSPFRGTRRAHIKIPHISKCLKQMEFDSPFTQQLQKKMSEFSFPTLHVGSRVDGVVLPFQSSLPFRKNAVHCVFEDGGHNSPLISSDIAQRISQFYTESASKMGNSAFGRSCF